METARIVANGSGVSLHTSTLGLRGSKQWNASQIQSVYPKITMQSGQGGQGIAYYTVTLKDDSQTNIRWETRCATTTKRNGFRAQIQQIANLKARTISG